MIKRFFINNSISIIKKNKTYNEEKIEIIKYGLEAIYLLISKLIIIFLIAVILDLVKEFLLFALFYNIIRLPSFGLHATKSWVCLVSSTIIFILTPYLSKILELNIYLKIIVGVITIILIFKNAPADTHKKPIINPFRRKVYKLISVLIAITFSLLAIFINNSLISNLLLFSLIIQNFMISPTIYRLFNLPYNNYLNYIKENNINVV